MLQSKYKWVGIILLLLLIITGCTKEENTEQQKTNQEQNATQEQKSNTEYEQKTSEEKNIDALTVDQILTMPDSIVALVNKTRYLPSDYTPENLTVVAPDIIPYTVPGTLERNMVRSELEEPLLQMISDSQAAGLDIWVASAYRSYERQKEIFDHNVEQVGYDETIKVVALPGTSEHQTGLCIDFTTESVGFTLEENFEETAEGKWLKDNAHRYGFIMRYPKGKEEITGYSYEPWHFRYVGADIATEIYNQDSTLEEYKNIL